ncbi:Ger(x)C family spore germination C-terminal domain-containing protein [Cohnella ginsengisoli]|uniref:Ger(X)C family spore germination C-terminal domain-containing protein n=1 Tax=Cohnella ginsengisoli TaxID=425004 RepID=A0A9X4QP24_9BACL|nr:Ger(x)C family spore germination C-terminal domain-containing protein [Cohnella ginsengisoli]MDG0793924.1 Ger(x)C family spore germination C-terminal domain-containing protein [Cohnella ginsengisoli]
MGTIEVESEGNDPGKAELFKLAGAAVFKDLRLVGLLNGYETDGLNWATNHMKDGRINAELPGGQGNVGMLITHAERKITAEIKGDRVWFNLLLQGRGTLIENNTDLDITRPKMIALVQHALEQSAKKQVQDVIIKLQRQYNADAVGFGQILHRNKPKEWKKLKSRWDRSFAKANIAVDVKLTIGSAGMSGPPLQLNQKENRK